LRLDWEVLDWAGMLGVSESADLAVAAEFESASIASNFSSSGRLDRNEFDWVLFCGALVGVAPRGFSTGAVVATDAGVEASN